MGIWGLSGVLKILCFPRVPEVMGVIKVTGVPGILGVSGSTGDDRATASPGRTWGTKAGQQFYIMPVFIAA